MKFNLDYFESNDSNEELCEYQRGRASGQSLER